MSFYDGLLHDPATGDVGHYQYDSYYDESRRPFWKRIDLKSPLLTIGVVTGVAMEIITLPLWIDTFGEALGGPYFILFLASFVFAFVFMSLSILWKLVVRKVDVPSFFGYLFFYVVIGFFNGANGILLVYASPPSRTPPLLQALLVNTTILWGMLATRLIISKNEARLSYLNWLPMLALVLIVAGIGVSLVPLIRDVADGKEKVFSNKGGIVWVFIFMGAIAPGAFYNVVQEKFLKLRARATANNPNRSREFDMVVMLAWSCLFQFLFIAMLFWVDVIPHFGFSKDFPTFADNLKLSFECYFNQYPGCSQSWWHGVLFITGYFLAYFCSAGLNESSANYNLVANTLTSPVAALFWLIFPRINPQNSHTPLWSVLPSLFLLVLGSFVWKYWENREHRKLNLKEAMRVN